MVFFLDCLSYQQLNLALFQKHYSPYYGKILPSSVLNHYFPFVIEFLDSESYSVCVERDIRKRI